jgi:hypothetical protein
MERSWRPLDWKRFLDYARNDKGGAEVIRRTESFFWKKKLEKRGLY